MSINKKTKPMIVNLFYKVTESVHNLEKDKHLFHEENFNEGTLIDRRSKAINYYNDRLEGMKDNPGFYAPFMSYEEAKKQSFKSFAAYSIDLWVVINFQDGDTEEMSFTEDPEILEEVNAFERHGWIELTEAIPPPMSPM